MQDRITPDATAKQIEVSLTERFGESFSVDPQLAGLDELARIAGHRVHRRFLPRAVEPTLLRLLCACALSAPSKSDLQQADILAVKDKAKQRAIAALIPDMPWIADAPVFLVFLANGSRLPQIARRRDKPFPNDHLDLFFNAAMSAGYTDSRWLRNAGIPAYGISGLFSDPGNNGVHGKNEQVAVTAVYDSKEFLYRLVRRLAGPPAAR